MGPLEAAAGLVRKLHFRQEKRVWIHPSSLSRHASYLSHFNNVTTLVFANLVTSVFHEASLVNCFKPLNTSVRTLSFYRPIARPVSLMRTILLFPAVVDIQISSPRWSIAEENLTLHPPPKEEIEFTGILHLRGFGEKWAKFFTLLSTRRLRFQKVRLTWCEFNTSVPMQALLEAVSQGTSALHLAGSGKRGLDFEPLRESG